MLCADFAQWLELRCSPVFCDMDLLKSIDKKKLQILLQLRVCNQIRQNKKAVNLLILVGFTAFLVDLAGIEPASESLSLAASPITVADLTFPWQYAHRQAYCFSSFIIHLPGQSLPGKVSHIVGARFLMCECVRADEQHLGC